MRLPVSLHTLDLFQTRQGENFSFLVSHLSSFRGRRRRAFGQRFEFPWIEPDEVAAGADVEILDSLTGYNGNLSHPQFTGRTRLAGAVPAGASVAITVPHGVQLEPQETSSAFGIKYYLVAWEGQSGWLPEIYTETMPPVCA